MRARASSTPSKRPTDRPNCLRMRAYAPPTTAANFAPPLAVEGRVIERPTARHSLSMFQPRPAFSTPPMSWLSGRNTSWPRTGPFWNGELSGKWRRPTSTPRVSRGSSARVMPMSRRSPISPSGSYMRKARPMIVATGASVM